MLILKREPVLEVRHKAFLYQVQAVEAVRSLEYAALFHEQGLGKTKIGIDLALTWLKEDVCDSAIIVTKRSLVKNWTDEIKAHTFFEPRLLGQDRNANFFAFNSPARLYLAHYEVLKSEARRFALFLKTRHVAVILDEAHKIKNPDAEITKAFHQLAPGFVRRVIMTGTPVANRPYDLWAQIKFLDGGKSLGNSFEEFREALDLGNELAQDASARERFESKLAGVFEKIHPFTVRETKSSAGIELPEKTIENVTVEMEARQRDLYEKFRTELRAEVMRGGQAVEDDAEDVLKRLLRLVQIASNPALVDESYSGVPGKLSAARDIAQTAIGDSSKIIVWTGFIANADWLGRQFADLGSAVVHGKKAMAERNAAIDRFKQDSECRVLIATPPSAKEGLTLTVANYAIFYDRSFSLDDYLQAQDRIHRISQSRTCRVWNLIATGTIDEWVDMLLAAKHLAAQLAQGDIEAGEYKKRASYDFGRVIQEILGQGDGGSAEKEEHGFLRIRGEDIPVRTVWVEQSKLRFFVDNPRIYSIVRSGDRHPEQENIYEELLKLEHLPGLKEDIKLNGGLIDPLIVRTGTLEVVEGNSRLAAYRWLYRNDNPSIWAKVKCMLLPEDIDEQLVFALLGQYHIKGRKDWQPFEQAGFLYRRFQNQKQDIPTVAAEFGLRVGEAKHLIRVYEFMVKHGEDRPDRWSYYFEYLRNNKIAAARAEYPNFDDLIVKKIRSAEIKRAVDVRDSLPMVCNEKRFLKRLYEGALTFAEAVERAEDAGGDNADLQRIKKFAKWLALTDTESDLIDNEKNIRDKISYELTQIEKRIARIKTKLQAAKEKEERELGRRTRG